jgi:carboxyl-terminal processing protease
MNMIKIKLIFITTIILVSCVTTQPGAVKPAKFLGATPEDQLIGKLIDLIDNHYIDPVSYQTLMSGAIKGLEILVGPTGLMDTRDAKVVVISPQTRQAYNFSSGSEEDFNLFIRAVFDVVDFAEATYSNHTRLDIVESMSKGILSALDYQCKLIAPGETIQLVNRPGHIATAGLILFVKEDYPAVLATHCGSPAQKADIRVGDKLVAIAGVPTKGLELASVIRCFAEHKGDPIDIEVLKGSELTKQKIQLIRTNFPGKTVYLGSARNKYAHIWVPRFDQSTVEELSNILTMLEDDPLVEGIILDLRFNTGGVLSEAIRITNLFMNDGVITQTKGKSSYHTRVFKAFNRSPRKNYKMVLLTNGMTAGGAEIVTAALQDNQIALVMGMPTHGYPILKTRASLTMGYAVTYPVSKSYRPKSNLIEGDRVQPDVLSETQTMMYMENLCDLKADEMVEKAYMLLDLSRSAKHKDMLKAASSIQ